MIHCPQCGKACADSFKFCLGCGADLGAAVDLQSAIEQPTFSARRPSVPPPPREPTKRTRGIIHAYTGAQFVGRLLGMIFTAIGLVMFLAFGTDMIFDVAVSVAGKPVKGVVTGVHTLSSVRVNHSHPRVIEFSFDGHHGASSTLDFSRFRDFQPGSPVDVDAVPGWPAAARVHGTMRSPVGWFGLFPLPFLGVGLIALFIAVRSNRREIRAFRFGVAAVGRVKSIGLDRSVRVNGRSPTLLSWEFDVAGKTYGGSLSHMDGGVLRPLVAADHTVAVVYDPKDPRANTLYVV